MKRAATPQHSPSRMTTRSHAIWLIAGVGLAAALSSAVASAYEQYSVNKDATNCRACHGDFRAAAPYISANDGVSWRNPANGNAAVNLHDGHRTYMLSGDCGVCHTTGGRFPVSTFSSDGGGGLAGISCIGCHGRAEPNAGGAVKGTGLRQHHYRSGVTECIDCHADADPAAFTTADEHTFPPFYATPDANHPDKPTNPCNNLNATEAAVAPGIGLDNDGDLAYDGAEPECSSVPVHSSTWGHVKVLYR
jgi:hypothetical protein